MADYQELEGTLSLVENLCTSDQVKELLRKRKGDEHVRLSAETKNDLVHHNLRDAVVAGTVPIGEVFDLIRESEENGNQHIFYYRVRVKKIADALDYESVARNLWGPNWEKAVAHFPTIKMKPHDYTFSDFRLYGPKKPKDWVLKVYGHAVLTRATGKEEKRSDNTFWREFIEEELRIVLVVRWNHPDLLEIRVQRNESRRRIDEWQKKLWQMLTAGLSTDQFAPWELSTAMTRLVLEHDKHKKLYTFRDASIDDMGVHAEFQAYSDEGDLFASQRSIDAIRSYLKAEGDCRGLTVTWLANPHGPPQKEVKTLLGAKERHEVVISGHCPGGDLDHVTDELRSFNKTIS